MWNLADLLGLLFLGYGILDGYRKGLVKKGISLAVSFATLAAVYLISPYVAQFIQELLPEAMSLEMFASTDNEIYRMLFLSGFGEAAEEYKGCGFSQPGGHCVQPVAGDIPDLSAVGHGYPPGIPERGGTG